MGVISFVRRKASDRSGQATVEFAVGLPVLIIVAVIAVNALTFFSECASFDRLFRGAVRVHATSPAYGQDVAQSCSLIEATVQGSYEAVPVEIDVAASGGGAGLTTYTGTITFAPTLFGLGAVNEVFGVALPRLVHTSSLTVDQYKPGVIV